MVKTSTYIDRGLHLQVFESTKMVSSLISQKENVRLILLPIVIATHASLVINHQEKKKKGVLLN